MIQFRTFREEDVEELSLLLNNPNVSQFTSDHIPYPYTKEDAIKFLERVKTMPVEYMNAVTLNGKLIGGAGIHPQEMNLKYNAEIGYWLGQEYWGKGYATEVVQKLISIAKESKNFHKLFARTFEGNLASEKVLQKNGFVHEGTLKEHIFKRGKFLNEKIWGLIL